MSSLRAQERPARRSLLLPSLPGVQRWRPVGGWRLLLRSEQAAGKAGSQEGGAEVSERIARIREKLKQIVCTEGDDRGVVLLSQESPTYYDEHLKAHVYKHLHFSPLGDALIELWDIVEAEPGWGDWRSVKESGWYWWWNQDLDSAPVPVSILHDGHGLYFASKGQLGWTRAQNVEEMVGLWMPVTEPEVPRELGEACDL